MIDRMCQDKCKIFNGKQNNTIFYDSLHTHTHIHTHMHNYIFYTDLFMYLCTEMVQGGKSENELRKVRANESLLCGTMGRAGWADRARRRGLGVAWCPPSAAVHRAGAAFLQEVWWGFWKHNFETVTYFATCHITKYTKLIDSFYSPRICLMCIDICVCMWMCVYVCMYAHSLYKYAYLFSETYLLLQAWI